MKTQHFQSRLLLAVLVAAAASVASVRAAQPPVYYSVTDLGTLGGPTSRARAIHRAGQVVGEATTSTGAKHAFRTAPDRPMDPGTDDLGTLGGSQSTAADINDAGWVVGDAHTPHRRLPRIPHGARSHDRSGRGRFDGRDGSRW